MRSFFNMNLEQINGELFPYPKRVLQKAGLKHFTQVTRKHLRQHPFSKVVEFYQKLTTKLRCFPVTFTNFDRTPFSERTPLDNGSVNFKILISFCSFLFRNSQCIFD